MALSQHLVERFREFVQDSQVPCEIELPDGDIIRVGDTEPRFRARFNSERAFGSGADDDLGLGMAYVNGDIDIEGDVMSVLELRSQFKQRFRFSHIIKFLFSLGMLSSGKLNKKSVDFHYSLGDEFYLKFLDTHARFYSECLFETGNETLEEAAEHKLKVIYDSLELAPGKHLLDIGSGWGGILSYAASRGVKVTSLTLAEDSYNYVNDLISTQQLPAEVKLEDFLKHEADESYDAIVILGVIEHLPYYRRFSRQVWQCLKPGGMLYLDGSATKEKYNVNQFSRKYIWEGVSSFMCLQDVVGELILHGMKIQDVRCESRDYEITMRHWSERFEAARDEVVARWGEQVYRVFRMYLWGGCYSLANDRLQAYRILARKGPDEGPRPGFLRRFIHFIKSLV